MGLRDVRVASSSTVKDWRVRVIHVGGVDVDIFSSWREARSSSPCPTLTAGSPYERTVYRVAQSGSTDVKVKVVVSAVSGRKPSCKRVPYHRQQIVSSPDAN